MGKKCNSLPVKLRLPFLGSDSSISLRSITKIWRGRGTKTVIRLCKSPVKIRYMRKNRTKKESHAVLENLSSEIQGSND